jgi:hypothetical protein
MATRKLTQYEAGVRLARWDRDALERRSRLKLRNRVAGGQNNMEVA